MNKKEIAEIKKQFNPERCSITRICGCYVDGEKNKKAKLKEAFLSLPEEEMFKYFDIFKKTLSGKLGKNLMNLEFPLAQEREDGTQEFFMRLRKSKLKDDTILDEFYDKIIENYDYSKNYYIIIIHAVYDIPGKTSDKFEIEDASEEIYEHILCSICPVNLSKTGLSYDSKENAIKDRIRDWVVGNPEVGFLFPAFNDRSTDIHATLYYNKSIRNIHEDFVKNVLGTPVPLTPEDEKARFFGLINDIPEEYRTFDFMENLTETFEDIKEQAKDSPEATTLSGAQMKRIFINCGVPEDTLVDFDEHWHRSLGDESLVLDNIHFKMSKITTDNAAICIPHDRIELIGLQNVQGIPLLVIPVNGKLEVNGIVINLREASTQCTEKETKKE